VTYWNFREQLSRQDKLRRSVYETLRDELDQYLIECGLVQSYQRFVDQHVPYPFVEKRELKPRARIPDVEFELHNRFLVIFVEDVIPSTHKKYIRFFDDNKTTKENLMRFGTVQFSKKYTRNVKQFESSQFSDFLKGLLPVDYALLIQRDPTIKARNRYSLSHFRVRIDWPIADAAEDMARSLRYISKDLYEKGDKYAEDIQKKFFEYYGLPVMAGGRRTAAIVASQYMKRIPGITTVYAGSSESRSLLRISERGVSKAVLMKFSNQDLEQILESKSLSPHLFKKYYMVAREKKDAVCIFQATYAQTYHSRPPEDGKLRDIKSDLNWLAVGGQHILPKPGVWKYPPLPINIIYT
jgi:hypothetical protein